MILGILTAVVFALASGVFFTQKCKNGSRLKKLFSRLHKPLGYLFVGLTVVHLAGTLPLIRQRPVVLYLLGAGMLLFAVAAVLLIRLRKDRRKAIMWHKLCALAIALLLVAHVISCVTSLSSYQREVAALSFSQPPISHVSDGTYTGVCDVGYIYARVSVTVSGGAITDIELLEHRNERGKAGEGVIDEIRLEQRTDVDAVSGATNSSKVIKKAVENALEKGINSSSQTTGGIGS